MGNNEVWKQGLMLYHSLKGFADQLEECDLQYVNHGQQKYVFKMPATKVRGILQHPDIADVLAIAMPIDQEHPLQEEFDLLNRIHHACGTAFTPRPEFYLRTRDSQVLGMEYLPGKLLRDVVETASEDEHRNRASRLGTVVGTIYQKTRLFHCEPHNENLLETPEGLKFIDAIHFEKGSVQDLIETYTQLFSHDRVEVARYPDTFLKSLHAALR